MAERQAWHPVLFHCPQTGHKVQGLLAEDTTGMADGHYEAVACIACAGTHFINRRSGALLGTPRDRVG